MSETQQLNKPALRAQLILATVVVFLIFGLAPSFGNGGSYLCNALFFGLHLSFACMVGIWCATSIGWIRFLVSIPILFLWGYPVHWLTGGPWLISSLIPVCIGIIVSLVIEAFKFAFGSFEFVGSSQQAFREGLQFKISHLLILTTAFAILVAVSKAAGFSGYEELTRVSVLIAIFSANTLLLIWALLGRTIGWRLFVALVCQLGLSTLGCFIFNQNGDMPVLCWALMNAAGFVVILLHFFLLRRSGLRFVQRSSAAPTLSTAERN